jgi:glycosyltransferase involved in cell wall biosynthesis
MTNIHNQRARKSAGVMFLTAHDTPGGTANYIKTLRDHFEQDGITCCSLALYSGLASDLGAFEEALTPRANVAGLDYLKVVARFLRRVRTIRPAVILTVMPMANVAAGLAGWISGAKVLCTHHSPYDKNGRVVRILDMILGTVGAYRSIVCVSNAVAESYANHPRSYRKRLKVIPNGIPTVYPDASRAEMREKYQIAPGRPFGLSVGRLAEQKNILRTAEAMSQVSDADFLIVGTGPLEDQVRVAINQFGASERVRLVGAVERQEAINLMHACDVFVQASLFEGQSLALLEAARTRANLVVSSIPEQLEVVKTPVGLAAIVCDPADSEDITRAIRTMLFDPVARQSIAAGADFLSQHVKSDKDSHAEYSRMVSALIGNR